MTPVFDGLEKFAIEQKEKFKEFDSKLLDARTISRDVIYKIIIVCSSTIGFSLTLVSIPNIGFSLDINLLKISWYLFLTTIILGYTSIFLEGRIHYALHWKAFQLQDYDDNYGYSVFDKLKVVMVGLYSILLPRNLIFCKKYKTKLLAEYNSILNGKVVSFLAEMEKLCFMLENLFIVVFIAALTVFIRSYK